MKTLTKSRRTKLYVLITVFSLVVTYVGGALAISVSVGASKQLAPSVKAIGFSIVGKKGSYGWLGHTYKRTNLPEATYSFGYRDKSGKDVSCGTARLTKDSTVVLYTKGGKCALSVK